MKKYEAISFVVALLGVAAMFFGTVIVIRGHMLCP